jgi:hypothetical protein
MRNENEILHIHGYNMIISATSVFQLFVPQNKMLKSSDVSATYGPEVECSNAALRNVHQCYFLLVAYRI